LGKKTIEVCYSPKLFELFSHRDHIVVVIDVLRATSSICVAFEYGADHIVPVSTIEESMAMKRHGYLVGAERHGEMIEGFDFGNSPYSYMDEKIRGAAIALTTTNGTKAIAAAKAAYKVVIGSFLNQDALCDWLLTQERSIVCLCAGWQNKFNLEDTLLAGAIVNRLKQSFNFTADCDSAIAAEYLYLLARNDLFKFLENSSHRKRLARLHIERDIEYCLKPNQTRVIPLLQGNRLVRNA
jgi:2-phosphosulfolactate phosphatase